MYVQVEQLTYLSIIQFGDDAAAATISHKCALFFALYGENSISINSLL